MATPHHEIPTHLNVEDRGFLGLSMHQFLVLIVGLASGYALWERWPGLPPGARLALAAAPPLIAACFALVRSAGRGLEVWSVIAFHYAACPRVALWRPDVEPAGWRPEEDDARLMPLHVHWHPAASALGDNRTEVAR